ncbi:hypothetical protein PG999_002768 [Apiospora kogelbergensis]|uniref:DUF6604 domain-containing protein n=1 Tax=Apiospora kogelbergensis TaxID=1337665 RepID=A0AAW0R9B2_9PEZI
MASKVSPPTEILTTYRQYKRDTESIAGWLADNALKCGFKLAGAATASGPRLKGKARKQAQASRSQQSHTVKVSELIGMADTIIKHKPTPHVPKVLGSLFQRAIDARRDCSHWYQHHGNGDKYSNRRHQHFTNVLQDVWEALRPFQGSQTKWTGAAEPNKKERKNNNDTASDYVNRFAGLQVQNILSPDLDGAEKSIPKVSLELPNIAPAVIEKEEDDIEADFFFAIYSFLCDVKKLRRTVQHYWSDYASGKMELTVASMLTNIVIILNQNVNHLFIGGIPKSSSEAFRKLNLAFGMRDTDRYAQVRLVSNPNPLQAVLKDWIHGIKADNAEVWLLELMAVVYDPKIFRETARRAGISATEIESQLAQWSNAGSDPAQFLEVLSFYLTTNTDMYFEWHQMHACAEAIWRNLNNAIYNKRRKRYDCAPIVAFETLKEAELAEETAADAHLLNNAWESIKELCEKGLGDACIEGLVKKAGMDEMLRPCIYVAKKLDVLYMNWPQERKSSFAYKKLATIAAKNAAAGAQW